MADGANLDLLEYPQLSTDATSLRKSVARRMLYSLAQDPYTASPRNWASALSLVIRDLLVERWFETERRDAQRDARKVYYLSMEFLMGRTLINGLLAIGLYDDFKQALAGIGVDLDAIAEVEPDAALGNGGLGRLAACFLDSAATLGVPCTGYGIRYEYGMFAQQFSEGRQVEAPDHWLQHDNPWEFPYSEQTYTVQYGGRVEREHGGARWVPAETVLAMAYDTVIPGHGTRTANTLRLWSARANREIELDIFNDGDYNRALEVKNRSENLSHVLYPDDRRQSGRELRLRQEYFFVCASMQDMLRRHLRTHPDLSGLADKVAVHLNDTHPAIAVPELMRLLVDVHHMEWDRAWSQCNRIFSYTNHTLLPEALETWPLEMIRAMLPRHMEIIFEINKHFLDFVRSAPGVDPSLVARVSLIDENGERRVRMANLSVVGSHKVNGVSKLHSRLMRETIFADFAQLYPDRFINITNGITQRRWLSQANPGLARLIDARIGTRWRYDLEQLAQLKPHADDPQLMRDFLAVKAANKRRLAAYVQRECGVEVAPDSLFDVQVKRIHEYKRQLLNALHVISRYNAIRANPTGPWVPRTVIFSGKAASAYWMAKLIIKLINDIARKINSDPVTARWLKVAFIPNFGVSLAELIMPAADLSEQISTAGTEASGTGNMKLALNGALTIGTEDGANIEIREAVGADNIFIFGHTAPQIRQMRMESYDPRRYYAHDPALKQALDQISSGFFSPHEPSLFQPIVDSLLVRGDTFMLLADFAPYAAMQKQVDEIYARPDEWGRRAWLNVCSMGAFSSDRSVAEYAGQVWGIRPEANH
jgi:starch phosphorylase